jgi:hypothetical protein
MDKVAYKVWNIEWDTDGEDVCLPKTLDIELDLSWYDDELDDEEIEEMISNELSNITDWLVSDFEYKKI